MGGEGCRESKIGIQRNNSKMVLWEAEGGEGKKANIHGCKSAGTYRSTGAEDEKVNWTPS